MPRHRAGSAHVAHLLLTGDNYIRRPARHRLLGSLLRAVHGRLAGYEDVNGAERLGRDPAMRAIVGREGLDRPAASTSEMGRSRPSGRSATPTLAALTDLSGAWIDRVHGEYRLRGYRPAAAFAPPVPSPGS